jgi:hypothetical protein
MTGKLAGPYVIGDVDGGFVVLVQTAQSAPVQGNPDRIARTVDILIGQKGQQLDRVLQIGSDLMRRPEIAIGQEQTSKQNRSR